MSLIQYPVDKGQLLVCHVFALLARSPYHSHVSAASVRDGISVLVSWSLQLVIVISSYSRLLTLLIFLARPHDDDEGASPRQTMKLDQIGRQSDTGSCLLRLLQDSIDCNLPSVSRA